MTSWVGELGAQLAEELRHARRMHTEACSDGDLGVPVGEHRCDGRESSRQARLEDGVVGVDAADAAVVAECVESDGRGGLMAAPVPGRDTPPVDGASTGDDDGEGDRCAELLPREDPCLLHDVVAVRWWDAEP